MQYKQQQLLISVQFSQLFLYSALVHVQYPNIVCILQPFGYNLL